ncbi:hypothetical protein LINGRAHAP2_LOCUS5356 [Linum grandiflorum]
MGSVLHGTGDTERLIYKLI